MTDTLFPRPGQSLARGVCRALAALDFAPLTEVTLATGLRVDVMALGPAGEIWVVECKASRADFAQDRKWQGYLDWCDRYFWAVDTAFPADLLPDHHGLILADAWGGEVVRMPVAQRLAGARRAALTRQFARTAARSLMGLRDPSLSAGQA